MRSTCEMYLPRSPTGRGDGGVLMASSHGTFAGHADARWIPSVSSRISSMHRGSFVTQSVTMPLCGSSVASQNKHKSSPRISSLSHPPHPKITQSMSFAILLLLRKIQLSVQSMLLEPNTDSPANIDASKMFKEDPKAFRRKVL